jgi:hypothetical protein
MSLNEICSKVCTGNHLSDALSILNGLKQRDDLFPFLLNFAL